MAQLLDLPPELTITIFFLIDNIDDALHLARTCRSINAIFEAPGRRLSILTRVIQNGDHHKYDLRLHASENYCADFRNMHYNDRRMPSDSERPFFPAEFFDRGFGSLYTRLGPDTVWSIVCRWHAMKTLFKLYCDSNIRPAYLRSIFWQTAPEVQTRRWQKAVAYELELPTPSGKECRAIRSMPIADKMGAYARFYRAVCSHWLCVNITWAAGISQHVDLKACEDAFGNIKLLWCDDLERPLLEKIEAIEATDFVWGFLARKRFEIYLDSENCPGWLDYNNFIEEPILFNRQDMLEYGRLVRLATFYLSPPHILELLHDKWRPDVERAYTWNSRIGEYRLVTSGLDGRSYLRKLGLWDEKFGVYEGADGQAPIPHFSTDLFNMIEWWGLYRLTDVWSSTQPNTCGNRDLLSISKWRKYRLSRWIDDLRGQPILYPETEEQLLERINEYHDEQAQSSNSSSD